MDIKESRIMTFGYDANVLSMERVTSERLTRMLFSSLCDLRIQTATEERAIIFVCHGFGGLLVKNVRFLSRDRVPKR